MANPSEHKFAVGDGDTSFGKELFDFTETEAEPMIEPNGMANNFGWKAVTVVAGYLVHH